MQGPHQLAQKSTSTGTLELSTSCWKLSLVMVKTAISFILSFGSYLGVFPFLCFYDTPNPRVFLCPSHKRGKNFYTPANSKNAAKVPWGRPLMSRPLGFKRQSVTR